MDRSYLLLNSIISTLVFSLSEFFFLCVCGNEKLIGSDRSLSGTA